MCTEPALALWHNGDDYVVASSAAEAARQLTLHTGDEPSSASAHWEVVPPNVAITLWCVEGEVASHEAPGGVRVTRSAAYWIESQGAGYLASESE